MKTIFRVYKATLPVGTLVASQLFLAFARPTLETVTYEVSWARHTNQEIMEGNQGFIPYTNQMFFFPLCKSIDYLFFCLTSINQKWTVDIFLSLILMPNKKKTEKKSPRSNVNVYEDHLHVPNDQTNAHAARLRNIKRSHPEIPSRSWESGESCVGFRDTLPETICQFAPEKRPGPKNRLPTIRFQRQKCEF